MTKKAAKATRTRKKAVAGSKRTRKPKRTSVKADRGAVRSVAKRRAETRPGRSTSASLFEDLLAIQQLLHKYCHVLDRGTLDEITELFHRDAVLLPVYESDHRYVGRDAVRDWYKHYDQNLRANVRYLRHKIECPKIEISGNAATSVCYLDADAVPIGSDESMVFVGRYDDKLIRNAGQWWFKERKIIAYYTYFTGKYFLGRGQ